MKSEFQFEQVFGDAWNAGMQAGADAIVNPMYVQDGQRVFTVDNGVCGFAWVVVAGNTGFGRWLKKTGRARKAYGGGLQIWIGEHGQSMTRKEAHAYAMAAHFQNAGIKAHACSRMD